MRAVLQWGVYFGQKRGLLVRGKLRWRLLLHGLALLLAAALPFIFGLYQNGTVFLLLLLLIWPGLCFLSPFLLAYRGAQWYFALPAVSVFFIVPLCALLTPPGLELLGAYPVMYGAVSLIGLFVGMWRYRKRQVRVFPGGLPME